MDHKTLGMFIVIKETKLNQQMQKEIKITLGLARVWAAFHKQ